MRRDYTFWGLDELNLEPCCALKFYPEMQNCVQQTDADTKVPFHVQVFACLNRACISMELSH